MKSHPIESAMAFIVFFTFLVIPFNASCEDISSDIIKDIIKITAPNESATGSYPNRAYRQFVVEGWACGSDFSPQTVHKIRTANLISEELVHKIQFLREGLQAIASQKEEDKKQGLNPDQIKANTHRLCRAILSRVSNIDLILTDYQAHRTISARNLDEIERYYLQPFKKDIQEFRDTAAKGANRLADTSIKFVGYDTTLEQVLDNNETYAIDNCYTKSDLDVFTTNLTEAYQNAITLFDTYQSLKSEVEKNLKH